MLRRKPPQEQPGTILKKNDLGSIRLYSFIADGTEESPITITSTSTNQHTLYNLSYEDFVVSHCVISYSNAIGTIKIKSVKNVLWDNTKSVLGILKTGIRRVFGIFVNSTFIARNSTNSGNNSGWDFE